VVKGIEHPNQPEGMSNSSTHGSDRTTTYLNIIQSPCASFIAASLSAIRALLAYLQTSGLVAVIVRCFH